MPAERTKTETRSSMVMSRGSGVCAKVAVCSWEEYTLCGDRLVEFRIV